MNRNNHSKHIALKQVKINDSFWNNICETVRNNVIPYQYLALQDKIEDAEKAIVLIIL